MNLLASARRRTPQAIKNGLHVRPCQDDGSLRGWEGAAHPLSSSLLSLTEVAQKWAHSAPARLGANELGSGGVPGLPEGRMLQGELQIRAYHPGRRLRLTGNLPCISHPGRWFSAGA